MSDRVIVDTDAPTGYEVGETSEAKNIAMDVIQDVIEHCFWLCDEEEEDFELRMEDYDAISAADKIVEQLIAAGWRPTEVAS